VGVTGAQRHHMMLARQVPRVGPGQKFGMVYKWGSTDGYESAIGVHGHRLPISGARLGWTPHHN
jgi:hypothetical protein